MTLIPIELLFAVLLLLPTACFFWRRKKSKGKIRRMSEEEKCQRLSTLIEPFGFIYEPKRDILISHINAWQRKHGYETLFDELAPKFNMIVDACPVYFDYQDKTWLIEFWKGQYGINTGAEVGVYHSNRRVLKEQRKLIRYNAVSNEEMPLIGLWLEKQGTKLFSRKDYHWWLAAFRMGRFSNPKDLVMYANISFDNVSMAEAFVTGLREAGFSREKYRIRGRKVSVTLDETDYYSGIPKLHRKVVQEINRCFCGLYHLVTLPFTQTADRMLFLYEQLPWCFKHMLRLHAFGRKHR